jgi:alanine-glyoxylate transaminase/serine-glyoxylate transaminase/serine-pyruvate transaminase
VPSWYLDLGMIDAYWGSERAYHHTAPISMVYALHEGLGLLLDEGLEASFARHLRVQRYLIDALAELDLRPVVPEAIRLPMLTSVAIPEGVDDAGLRRDLYERFNIEIGGGLGPLKSKVWRIGLMGYGAREENVLTLTGALRDLIPRHRKTRPT